LMSAVQSSGTITDGTSKMVERPDDSQSEPTLTLARPAGIAAHACGNLSCGNSSRRAHTPSGMSMRSGNDSEEGRRPRCARPSRAPPSQSLEHSKRPAHRYRSSDPCGRRRRRRSNHPQNRRVSRRRSARDSLIGAAFDRPAPARDGAIPPGQPKRLPALSSAVMAAVPSLRGRFAPWCCAACCQAQRPPASMI
jgi:hypothetical protein